MVETTSGQLVPNFEYRYLSEDVPFGLVVTKAVAQLAQVETPAIDAVIRWAQPKLNRRYLVAGKLDGPDTRELPLPQNHGADTLEDLLRWYADRAT